MEWYKDLIKVLFCLIYILIKLFIWQYLKGYKSKEEKLKEILIKYMNRNQLRMEWIVMCVLFGWIC